MPRGPRAAPSPLPATVDARGQAYEPMSRVESPAQWSREGECCVHWWRQSQQADSYPARPNRNAPTRSPHAEAKAAHAQSFRNPVPHTCAGYLSPLQLLSELFIRCRVVVLLRCCFQRLPLRLKHQFPQQQIQRLRIRPRFALLSRLAQERNGLWGECEALLYLSFCRLHCHTYYHTSNPTFALRSARYRFCQKVKEWTVCLGGIQFFTPSRFHFFTSSLLHFFTSHCSLCTVH